MRRLLDRGPKPPTQTVIAGPARNLERDVSGDLIAVLDDATRVRRRTGGKDRYVGGRHVLFSILTSPEPEVQNSMLTALNSLGVKDARSWTDEVIALISESLERNENAAAWVDVAQEREVISNAKIAQLRAWAAARAPKAPAAPVQRDAVPNLGNDDPWAVDEESLGQDLTASALARLIASKTSRPPLAIGIFGPWGSGKSFLMRRVYEAVDDLTKAQHASFHEQVVQIRFNAWHYLDADLWASLAGHVFEELDTYVRTHTETDPKTQILGRLSTARDLTLETARALIQKRRAAQNAEKAHRDAEAALEKTRADFSASLTQTLKAGGRGAKALAQMLGQDPKTKAALLATVERVYGEPLETLTSRWRSVDDAGRSLKSDASLWLGVVRQFSWPVALAIAGLTTAAFLAPALLAMIPAFTGFFSRVSPVLSASVTLAGATAATVSAFSRKAAVARDAVLAAVRDYRQSVAGDLDKATALLSDDLAKAESALSLAEAEAERSRQTLVEALRQQADASRDYTAETSAGRLKAFIKAKAAQDGLYRSRQGLISAVRRDFADLAAMMNPSPEKEELERFSQQKVLYDSQLIKLRDESANLLTKDEWLALDTAAPQKPDEKPFSRIVLYIDDLDRCPPAKVVEVLQAVHLLLAYSLFVVVVAVDVRWLTGAICKVYPELAGDEPDEARRETAALDYLEKIFQVPIWTDPLKSGDAIDFVAARISAGAAAPAAPVAPPATPSVTPPTPNTKGGARKGAKAVATDAPLADPRFEPLKVPEVELAWLKTLAPSAAASPRRLLRLVNTYGLARASLDDDVARTLQAGGYRAFAALLVLAAAAPAEFDDLMVDLRKAKSMTELKTLWGKRGDAEAAARSAALLVALEREAIGLSPGLRDYVDLAARYSFTGGRSFTFGA